MMEERYVFQIAVTEEQKKYALKLVDYSIANHPVTDIFANDPHGKEREAIYAWIEMNGYNKKTLIQPEVLPAFYFYYIHSPKYDNNSNNIIPLHGHHLTTTIGYQIQQIKESDILSHTDFYFIYNEIFHYTELYDFLEEQGYNIKTAFEAGTAKVVYLYRDDRK